MIDLFEEIKKEENGTQKEKPKAKPLPTAPREITKEEKKELVKEKVSEFNKKINEPNNPYKGHKLINKRTLAGIWIFAIVCVLIFSAGMAWRNSILDKISDKDFSSKIYNNITTNVTAHFTEGEDKFFIYNNYTILNNYTINNTIIVGNTTI